MDSVFIGGLYQHFKGGRYVVVGLASPYPPDEFAELEPVEFERPVHSETERTFELRRVEGRDKMPFAYCMLDPALVGCVDIEPLVIYREYGGLAIWARPLSSWCQPATVRRFQLIG